MIQDMNLKKKKKQILAKDFSDNQSIDLMKPPHCSVDLFNVAF
jgi:hypothetical protein